MSKVENVKKIINEIKVVSNSSSNTKTEELRKLENLLFNYQDGGETREDLYANALRYSLGNINASESDVLIFNYLKEGTGQDGGYIVPDDILSDAKSIRTEGTNLETFVNVEPVSTDHGLRTYESRAAVNSMDIVEEGGTIPEVSPSDLIGVTFNIKKRAAIINSSAELFEDANRAVMTWLKKWIAKKSRATRNSAIISVANAITSGKEVTVASTTALRGLIASNLNDIYKDTAIALMNCTGYELLDNAGILEKDPTKSKGKLLYGLYPAVSVPDALLPNGTSNTPVFIGDLMEAITLFDREKADVNVAQIITKDGKDVASFKLRERIDVKAVDAQALVKFLVAK